MNTIPRTTGPSFITTHLSKRFIRIDKNVCYKSKTKVKKDFTVTVTERHAQRLYVPSEARQLIKVLGIKPTSNPIILHNEQIPCPSTMAARIKDNKYG